MRPTRQRCLGTLLTSEGSQSVVQGSREGVMVGMLQPLGLVLGTNDSVAPGCQHLGV